MKSLTLHTISGSMEMQGVHKSANPHAGEKKDHTQAFLCIVASSFLPAFVECTDRPSSKQHSEVKRRPDNLIPGKGLSAE